MKTKVLGSLTAATAALALVSVCAPAQAFSFGTGGISFTKAADVKFSFTKSSGAFTSAVKIFEVVTSNGKKSLGAEYASLFGEQAGASKTVSFSGNPAKEYTLALFSTYEGNNQKTVYSTSALNSGSSQQAAFGASGSAVDGQKFDAAPYQSLGSLASAATISFDDRGRLNGKIDEDFNDFTLSAEEIPEPATLGALALVGGAIAHTRRRRTTKVS